MGKLFNFAVSHRFLDHVLKVVLLVVMGLQSSCELVEMTSEPDNKPDKRYYNFDLDVREYGTEQPISGAWVSGYYVEVNKVLPGVIQQFSGTTNDSGLYKVKGRYYEFSHIDISGSQHIGGYFSVTNGQKNTIYLKQAAYLWLRFDFASLASKEPDGMFDKVRFTIGNISGEVSGSSTTGSMKLEGNQDVVVGLTGYKNGQLVKSWQNAVYLPGKQNTVHTVTMDHDDVSD